ncbi:hypothetical protein DDR33_20440 [Pararcticibacter amylolyticus]|uniref:Right handed beta helix domain-containing protein n=2 Tax=Pararcticibacter amylolyticus TaxID=2173175 RepID=A0A2U2PBL7_9SPHI|nr:hypothetical protein DDR33_20440 [Pararcticibacter amylolyticus]
MKAFIFPLLVVTSFLVCCKAEETEIVPEEITSVEQNLTLTDVTKSGISSNGLSDESQKIQSLIASNKKLFFPKGTYRISKPITLSKVNNLQILGEEGTVFTTDQNKMFVVSGSIKTLDIQRISFISTKNSTAEDAEGLIFIANYGASDVMDGININQCTFSIPNSKVNAIKMVSEGANSLVKNVNITYNKFLSIGRMGVEFQNHNSSPKIARFRDYTINNNYFNDIGTVQTGSAPSCISVSGYSLNGKINYNKIYDMRMNTTSSVYYGIENAGTDGLETVGNEMYSTTYGFTGILGSSTYAKAKWIIKDNIINLTGSSSNTKIRGLELNNIEGVVVANNKIQVDGYGMKLDNCKKGKITGNNVVVTKAGNVLYLQSGSATNEISSNTLDASRGLDHGVVIFNGSATSGNNAFQNTLIKPGNKKGDYVNLNGAVNSVK